MVLFARACLLIVATFVLALAVNQLFELTFGQRIAKTHLFYSPVTEKFIWRDTLLEPAKEGLEDLHHAQFVQMDEDGTRYTRRQFEELLPFIHYRDMEIWGLLPLTIKGRTYDKATIREARRVMEFSPRDIPGRDPTLDIAETILPLIDSRPEGARLVFPEDRFRLGRDELTFLNADYNRRDEEQTRLVTDALGQAGFVFPARLAASKPTILKPLDEGAFLVDAGGTIFQLKREAGLPVARSTELTPASGVRAIRVSESSRGEYYGFVLTGDGTLNLLTYDDTLTPLPLTDYDPETMEVKLLVNPLFRTAVYADQKTIRAVVMDHDLEPFDRYEHTMPGAGKTLAAKVFALLAPFRLTLVNPDTGYLAPGLEFAGWRSLVALFLALGGYGLVALMREDAAGRTTRTRLPVLLDGLLVLATGAYGLVAVLLIPHEAD